MAGRRRGPGQELKDFSTAFTQGYKIFADADRAGRGRSNDPYSDENLAKGDGRLGGQSFLGKLFGGENTSLTGADRGRAAIDQQMRIALERGDVSKYKQLLKDSTEFEALAKHSPVGEKPGDAPSSAKPVTGSPRADAGSAIPDPKATAASNDPTEMKTLAANDPIDLNTPMGGDAQDDSFTKVAYDTDTGPVYGADFSSIFSANGGMVPTRYAAIGGPIEASTPDPVKQAIPLSAPNIGAAEPTQDDAPPEEPEAEPANNQHEGKNLNLSSDPEELAQQAAPAVKAGLDRWNEEFKPRGAVGQDPEYRSRVEAFARGDGRLSDEEVAQIDRTIDPDNTMPPSVKTAARLAAVHKFFTEEGKPEVGNEMVARLMLYNKYQSQQHGAAALQAFKDGDVEGGAKALSDAYDNDPDAQRLKTKVNPDKTIDYETGYDRAGGFVRTGGGKATPEQGIQLASNTARGSEYMQRLHDAQAALNAIGGKGGKGKAAATTSTYKEAMGKLDVEDEDGKAPKLPERISTKEYAKMSTHEQVSYERAYREKKAAFKAANKKYEDAVDAKDKNTSATTHGKAVDEAVADLQDLKEVVDKAGGAPTPGIFDPDKDQKLKANADAEVAAKETYARGYYATRAKLVDASGLKAKDADAEMNRLGFETPALPRLREKPAAAIPPSPAKETPAAAVAPAVPPASTPGPIPPAASAVPPPGAAAAVQQQAPPAAPQAAAPLVIPPNLKPPTGGTIKNAQEALAKGAPREAVIRKLVQAGVDPRPLFKPLNDTQRDQIKNGHPSTRGNVLRHLKAQGYWVED